MEEKGSLGGFGGALEVRWASLAAYPQFNVKSDVNVKLRESIWRHSWRLLRGVWVALLLSIELRLGHYWFTIDHCQVIIGSLLGHF